MKIKSSREKRIIRHKRTRAIIKGTAEKPRLSVFRSNRHMWLQLIDDISGKTLVSANDAEIKTKKKSVGKDTASLVGELLAKRAGEKKIERVVFDRSGYLYHGLVREVAEGARKGGLKF
ncbi:MAG: 50S ribosomal protein L18 [bacterium]|nr:50S ribosomal protein L18 [bacterium]